MDQADRDDAFARILDDERAVRDRDADVETAQPAPAPAPPAEAPAQPEPVEATNEVPEDGQSADNKATAAAAFQAALNNLNSDDATTATKGDASEQAAGGASVEGGPSVESDAATLANTAKAGAATTSAVSATQTSAALLILANASGPTAVSGGQAADEEDAPTDAGTAEGVSTGGSALVALAGVAQPVTTQAATQAAGTAGKGDASIKAAAPNSAGVEPAPADVAGKADAGAATAKDGKPTDAAPQSASPASAQANAHPAASAATQANTATAAAASTDSAAQAITNAGNAASQASAQTASTSNPLTDATRAAATPPALQSAPAATIQVYTRFIERADGRAQRFEVRLDPVELGRVDVRIEIGADKKVHAVMAAHDSAALTDLMRGQKALERALSDAGIDLADNGLRFEIASDAGRGGASQQRDGDANGRSGQPDAWRKFDTASIPVSAEAAAATTPTRRSQRLDLVA